MYCVVFLTDFNDTSSIVVCCSVEKKMFLSFISYVRRAYEDLRQVTYCHYSCVVHKSMINQCRIYIFVYRML